MLDQPSVFECLTWLNWLINLYFTQNFSFSSIFDAALVALSQRLANWGASSISGVDALAALPSHPAPC